MCNQWHPQAVNEPASEVFENFDSNHQEPPTRQATQFFSGEHGLPNLFSSNGSFSQHEQFNELWEEDSQHSYLHVDDSFQAYHKRYVIQQVVVYMVNLTPQYPTFFYHSSMFISHIFI